MTIGEDDQNYQKLTSMLHWKADSATTTVGQLDAIYNSICQTMGASDDTSTLVCDLIEAEASTCLTAEAGFNLENKIVLAVGIRLAAERFMIGKIQEDEFVSGIEANQTQALIRKFKAQFFTEAETIKVLDRVALMTPENIHVNSFMYEPIIDMSDDHLRKLYRKVKTLQ